MEVIQVLVDLHLNVNCHQAGSDRCLIPEIQSDSFAE